jgi:membrane protease YdiL (CAAX protease family)
MRPMTLQEALLFFGVPGLSIYLLFSYVYEQLVTSGMPIHWATYLCLWGPLVVQSVIILATYRRSKKRFHEYFWVSPLSLKQLILVIIGFIVVQIGETTLGFTRLYLAALPGFHVPDFYPDLFRVDTEFTIPMSMFLGLKLSGNVFPLVFFGFWLVTNIACEELLWRGFALPRMELTFGKWAWLINGLLWNIAIHFFFRWAFIVLIPISIVVPYLSQRYKSLWPGVIIHGLGNLLIYVLLIPSYLAQ